MLIKKNYLTLACFILTYLSTQSVFAKDYLVDSKASFYNVSDKLVAGDTVILKNGTWSDFEVLLDGEGRNDAPITLKAETPGKVILSGQSNLRLSGQHLIVSGLVFKDGYTPSGAVIAFRRNKENLAYHSRVTQIVIDNYNNPDKQESDYWVAMYGQHNRLDHNHFAGKRNRGVTVAVRLNSENSQNNHHRIDHNYFGYRPTFGSNGGETLRIGTSHHSLSDSHTVVEKNYFEKTNGEVEIISVKSGANILRNNVFFEARGTLTLRHGNGNVVEENIFFGNGVDHTGGIRVINAKQTIRNNYLEGLTGYRFGSGFTIMNGVPDSPINRYHQVKDALVENNSFINIEHIQFAAGSDAERSAVPVDSVFQNNLVFNEKEKSPVTIFDDISGITFQNNIATDVPRVMGNGVKLMSVELERGQNGLLYPKDPAIQAGAPRDLPVLTKQETGVSWYAKKPAVTEFGTGSKIQVKADGNAFIDAVNSANNGDTLVLSPGEYDVAKIVSIDKTLTIKAAVPGKTKLAFQRTTLFEIHDGGNLSLEGLVVTGNSSPDSPANSVVRTKKWGMVENYRLRVKNCVFDDLNINHSFDFFVSGKGAFADEITIENSKFRNVSGDILALDKEIEDLGIYNAEYVTLTGNTFADVSGAIASLYRGGTDESTFGPHFVMSDNSITRAGEGKRNDSEASVYLHGVQVTSLKNNEFSHSAPVVVEHTVGEPKTQIKNNRFIATPAPKVKELHFSGPHTAVLSNNHIERAAKR